MDITDIQHKDAYISAKRKASDEKMHDQLPDQSDYSREIFIEFVEINGLTHQIEPQKISHYANTPFRFNFFFWKGT